MRVPTVHVVEYTALTTDQVLEAARDFSERRAQLWPDVHLAPRRERPADRSR